MVSWRAAVRAADDAAHIDGKRRFTRFVVVRSHVDRFEIEDAAGESRSAGLQNDATGCMFVVERGRRWLSQPNRFRMRNDSVDGKI